MIYDVNGNKITEESLPLFNSFSETTLIRHQAGNSASAFSTAYTNGYRAMEGDVRFTSDSVPVMSHDATMGGLTIASSTLAQLQAVTTVYTLEDWLIDCKKYNILAEIDFTKTYTDAQCAILVEYLKGTGMMARATVESYIGSSADTLAELSHEIVLSILQRSSTSLIDGMSSIASKIRRAICVIPNENASQNLVEYAHNKGYLTRVWTGTSSDTTSMVDDFLDMGFDQIITDNVKPSDITP